MVTIQFLEILQEVEDTLAGKLVQAPWLRLQPAATFVDDESAVVLAVATIHADDGTPAASTLDDLAEQDGTHGRRLSGQTVAELRIRQPNRVEEEIDGSTTVTVTDILPPATIGAGANGGLRVTVPGSTDKISFARDDDGPFAGLSINAGATTLQGSLHVDGSSSFIGNVGINNVAPAHQLDVNGSINATDVLRNGSPLVESKWDDANGGINFSGDRVGIGTSSPVAQLHVSRDVSGGYQPENHVAYFENTSVRENGDVLALRINRGKADLDARNNFITFFGREMSPSLGSIEFAAATNAVIFTTPGNDYAEWLPRLYEDETIEPGDIVGIFGGKASRTTGSAQQMMVASSNPIVVGNMPQHERRHAFTQVAFMGQAPVKVRGPVDKGDYIVASGLNDGTGIAVPAQQMALSQMSQVIGQAWEGSDEIGMKLVNTAVALHPQQSLTADLLLHKLQAQQAQIDDLHLRLTRLVPVG